MRVLRYDYRDVIGASALGLRGRKWAVAFPGVAIGMTWWTVLAWAALLARGLPPSLIWSVYGPVPWPSLVSIGGVGSAVLWCLATFGLGAAVLLTSTAISRVTYEQLKGNDFYSFGDAWHFAARKWKAVVIPPVLLAVGAGLMALILVVLAMLGGVWSPLPALLFPLGLAVAIALIYVGLVFGVGLTSAPAVVASSASETLETTFELFSLQSSQGKRVWWYAFLGAVVSAAYAAALWVLLTAGVLLTSWVFDMGRGGAVGSLLRSSLAWGPRVAKAINGAPGVLDSVLIGLGVRTPLPYQAYTIAPPSNVASGAILGLLFFLLSLLIMSQFLATYATCQTTSYVVLRQLKDEQNLLEEDLEE